MSTLMTRVSNLGLGTRMILASVLLLIVVVAINYVVVIRSYRSQSERSMIEKAAAFTALADETKNSVAAMHESGSFASGELVDEVKTAIEQGRSYRDTRIFAALPVVAGWESAQRAAEREDLRFRISSFESRNPENQPEAGSFREAMLRELRTQYQATGDPILTRSDASTNQLHYMRAIQLTDDCMMCHGQPGNKYDLDGDGKDILGFPMEGWAPGDMHGAYEVIVPLEQLDEQVAGFIVTGAMFTIPLIAGSCVLVWLLVRTIFQRPINALIERLRLVAEGDLTQRMKVDAENEIGRLAQWFNRSTENLSEIIDEVNIAGDEVVAAATEITSTSEEMVRGLEEQSSQVGQISSAIEEMSSSVSEVAAKSGDASQEATRSGTLAKEGGEVVHSTVRGMNAINDAVSASSESVQQLGKRGDEIGEIVSVINEIADQTNLLALNAAIEAARAGEHGRGFAVVADEVRKLAERTTHATEQIHGSITAIQSDTALAVERMDTGAAEVREGVDRARQAGASLESIVEAAEGVATSVRQIAAAAEEQSAASEQISRSVLSVSRVTQETSAGAGETARAAAMLSEKATSLRSLVARFKTERTGSS
ncbi:MAG: methyl-accepting chemotaxis protein [Planctomycetota bacterium]